MKPKKRILLILLFFVAVLISLPVWSVCHQIRQERLNRDLIAAVKKNDTATALALLKAGADANAQEKGNTPVSARQVLRAWWDRLRGRKPADTDFHPAALIIASDAYDRDINGSVTPPENVALVQSLLDHGADPNTRDKGGNTALIWAALHDHTTTARLL